MLSRLNGGHYPTTQQFEADMCLIAAAAQQRWQDDAAYAQDIGDAHELVDEAQQAVAAIPLELRRCFTCILARLPANAMMQTVVFCAAELMKPRRI